jgi:uncharacterized protein YbjT (DUF2867 family)
MNNRIVTLVGATGYLGEKIASELIAGGTNVRALVRKTANRSNLQKLGVTDFVTGDMMDPVSLNSALAATPKADAVISCAAGYTSHTKGDTPKIDTIGYRNLINAAKAADIPRFVLISILECDKAAEVPHFYHKFLVEQYLRAMDQPFIALRAGAFLDQAKDMVYGKVSKGVYPDFLPGVSMGRIYTGDLARYAAMAATMVPDNELGQSVDVGWDKPASGEDIANAFSKALGKSVVAKPAFPGIVSTLILPVLGTFSPSMKDMQSMMKWIQSGEYFSKNTQKQKQLFSDLPTAEEAVRRYCAAKKLI